MTLMMSLDYKYVNEPDGCVRKTPSGCDSGILSVAAWQRMDLAALTGQRKPDPALCFLMVKFVLLLSK